MSQQQSSHKPPKRSAGSLRQRRVQQDWPDDRDFRILSLDGGGIRGIFTAAYLRGLERHHLGGRSIASCFDLICGTSTGGIIALGLASGYTAADLFDLYLTRGREIFPPYPDTRLGRLRGSLRELRRRAYYSYDRDALEKVLTDQFGTRKFGDATTRLCIPAFEGRHSEVLVYKTPHHPDFKLDLHQDMVTVALATAAAPTYFRPLENEGYTLVDGGVWANNPMMIGLVDALSCYAVHRERIRVLSVGCGQDPYPVTPRMQTAGGMWHWRGIISGAMRLQAQNAIGQSCLLIGADRVHRVDRHNNARVIKLDDWRDASVLLPGEADLAVEQNGQEIAERFLLTKATSYVPVITM